METFINLYGEIIFRLLISLIVGAVIGAEREYRSKSAGFRTLMLISLGSTIFTLLSEKMSSSETTRIAANIVTGIGFLGAGAIFKDDNKVTGLTTAATVWITAALGMATGHGEYVFAIAGAVLSVLILWGMIPIENLIDRNHRVKKYKIVCKFEQKTLQEYEHIFVQNGLHFERGAQTRTGDEIVGNWVLTGADAKHEKLIAKLLLDEKITEFNF